MAILGGAFVGYMSTVNGDLYQWDTGRQIKIQIPGGCTVQEMHFENPQGETAYVVMVNDGVANIPNIVLQVAGVLVAYAVVTDANDRQTIMDASFTVIERQKPDDYVYTEEELKTYTALANRVSALEDTTVGGYKLLVTRELSNAVSSVTLGGTLKARRILVMAEITTGTATAAVAARPTLSTGVRLDGGSINGGIATSARTWWYECNADQMFKQCWCSSASSTSLSRTIYTSPERELENALINSITISTSASGSTSVPIPKGSVIKVYGVVDE